MKKLVYLIIALVALGLIVAGCCPVVPPVEKGDSNNGCTTIQSGELLTEYDEMITIGYDEFGYNYQAHMFSGRYCDSDRIAGGDYCDVKLIMKWNDAWLSNKSCDSDLLLDRPDNYMGSGAWLTNHQSGEYEVDGKKCKWTYFTKIVAAPSGAYPALKGDVLYWYIADTEIGPVIWGAFATIQSIFNDPCDGIHGVEYLSPVGPGFGKF